MTSIELIDWTPVAIWTFNSDETDCHICKLKFVDLCIVCDENQNHTKCKVSKGKCGHCFHKHCIEKLLSTLKSKLCPLCLTSFDFEVYDMQDCKK